jgi:hypothetical protein
MTVDFTSALFVGRLGVGWMGVGWTGVGSMGVGSIGERGDGASLLRNGAQTRFGASITGTTP